MSVKIKVYNQAGEAVGEEELASRVFAVKANGALVHQAAVAQLANARQVLAHTKDRSEVRGGGKKPWRQKGTGRARHGSSRSPLWIGGGVTFGPTKERNFKKSINKKMRQKALLMVLSDRVSNNDLVVLNEIRLNEFKTKAFQEILKALENKVLAVNLKKDEKEEKGKKVKQPKRSFLIILEGKDEKTKYSGRNLAGVKIINLENINIVDLLKYKNLILTQGGIKKLSERYKKD